MSGLRSTNGSCVRARQPTFRCFRDRTSKSRSGEFFLMYEWIKALHVIAIIAWMAGMLYLPRLFVYHCEAKSGSRQSETFKVMERRLLRAIINPAMAVTWVAGLWLAIESGHYRSGWMQGKFI